MALGRKGVIVILALDLPKHNGKAHITHCEGLANHIMVTIADCSLMRRQCRYL